MIDESVWDKAYCDALSPEVRAQMLVEIQSWIDAGQTDRLLTKLSGAVHTEMYIDTTVVGSPVRQWTRVQ